MIEYEGLFHIGIIVPDMSRGMSDIARRFGCEFPDPRQANVTVRYRGTESQVAVKFAYSIQGPPYIELIESVPGTVWEAPSGSRIHHLGVFCDNIEDEIAKLQKDGFQYEAASLGPDGSMQGAQYINSETLVRLELIRGETREGFLKMLSTR
ncbi:MAG: VOC family protein [Dehalococcoidia bacterium]